MQKVRHVGPVCGRNCLKFEVRGLYIKLKDSWENHGGSATFHIALQMSQYRRNTKGRARGSSLWTESAEIWGERSLHKNEGLLRKSWWQCNFFRFSADVPYIDIVQKVWHVGLPSGRNWLRFEVRGHYIKVKDSWENHGGSATFHIALQMRPI